MLLGVALLLVGPPLQVWAQQQVPQIPVVTPNVKEYGRPGYPVMTVYVWGNADTGVWNVEEGTDLLEFLSVVSRTQFGNRSPEERSTQILKLYRDGRTDGSPIFESRIEDLFTRTEGYPALQESDVLVLETKVRRRFTWRDVSQVVGLAATVLNTYLLLDRLSE
jgi:hypothetical protein